MAACGQATPDPASTQLRADATPPAVKHASGTATTSPSAWTAASPVTARATFSTSVLDRYGRATLEAVYKATAKVIVEETFQEARVRKTPKQVTATDFDSLKRYMTAGARKDLESHLATRLKDPENKKAAAGLFSVAAFAMNHEDSYSLRADVPPFSGIRIESANVALDSNGKHVLVELLVVNTARFESVTGDLVKTTMRRETTLNMLPGTGGEQPWLIDGWHTEQRVSEPLADTR
jgi:hypothetical protein